MDKEAVDVGLLLGKGIDGFGHFSKPGPFGVFFRSPRRGKTDVWDRRGGGVRDDDRGFTLEMWDVQEQLSRTDSISAMCFWNSSSFMVSSAFWAISVRRRSTSATHRCGGVTVTGKGAGVISVVPCATLVGGSVAFDTLDSLAIGKGVDLLMGLGVKVGVPQTLVLVLRSRSLGILGRFLVVE